MMALAFLGPIVLLGAEVQVAEQEQFDTLELRVTSLRPRQVVVDRGTVDGLALQDRVTFRPRDGRVFGGIVTGIGEREAVVDLDDPAIVPALGTKGDARIPRSRRTPPPPPAVVPQAGETAPPPPATPDHPPWERKADEWKSGEPLLSHVRPFRPDEREPRVSGNVYSMIDFAHTSEGPHSDTFARTGTSLLFENPFRRGGEVHADVEVNYRNTDVPDDDDEERTALRVDRLSYSWGGNRFTPNRYEVGRFLQYEMPEFGVLDGGQWSHRLPGGNSFGASVGYIPEQVLEQSTGDNLQFAGYYRWVADESEQLSLAAGYQKTFHDFSADRDLLIGKIVYLPGHDWDFTGTAWVDLYTAGDEAKGAGLGLTQAYLSTGKHWESGSTMRLTYTHLEFPENELDGFTPVTFDQLAHDHVDRVAATTRQQVGHHFGVFAQGGAWIDQDDQGADGELGLDFSDVAFEGSTVEFAGFYTGGKFSTTIGGRAGLGGTTSQGAWHLLYEFSYDDIEGFDADNNSLPQHRARASWDLHTDSRWSLSLYAEALLFDQENSILAGLFLQRSF